MADTKQYTVRAPVEWEERMEAIAQALSRPGLEVKLADAMRVILARGMDELEKELGISRADVKKGRR
jgi:predicted DNA-binding protein